MAGFQGFSDEALEFYEGLEADNSKIYWNEHRAIYDAEVVAPMQALIEELAPEFGAGRIMRPYRDVRFSKDKSPYKTALGVPLGEGFIHLSADGLGVGAGMYEMAPDQLQRYRGAVDADGSGTELVDVVASLSADDIPVVGHGVLKSAPRGYRVDHPRIEFLRYKGVTTWKQWPPEPWFETAEVKERIAFVLRASRRLSGWFDAHVGESTTPVARGR